MRRILSYCLTAALLSMAGAAARAAMPSYDNLYVFGDSYCDVGNIFALTGGAEPAAPGILQDFFAFSEGLLNRRSITVRVERGDAAW